jgi:hypothetical protein
MSNGLEDRMRALVAELVESAPEPSPFPVAEMTARRASFAVRRVQRFALATLVLVLVVGSAVGITTLLSVGNDNSDASATTSAPAATQGPTTTVISSETTTQTTAAAATTTVASETTAAPTAPPDPLAATVAALESQCPSFTQTLTPLFEPVPTTPEAYAAALDSLAGEMFGIRTAVAILGSGDEFDQLTSELDTVEQQVEGAREAGVGQADQNLKAIDTTLTQLGSSLVSFGATSCLRLATVIP